MKRFIGLFVLLSIVICSVSLAEVSSIDLLSLSGSELNAFSDQIEEVIELHHKPDSSSKDIALSVTKKEVESYFNAQGIEISWAWVDYSYTKDWDYYTITTHIDYKDASGKSQKPNVYAEVFPENGEHAIYYLLVGTEVLINRRDELPEILWNEKPESIINDSTGVDLAVLTVQELKELKARINDEYKANHAPKSSVTGLVLSLTEIVVEDYFEKQGYAVSWAWFDYDYAREWDFYSLATPITYKNDTGSYNADVYAEAYPFNSQYALCYLSVGDEVLIDNRTQLPANLYEHTESQKATSATLIPTSIPASTEKLEITATPAPVSTEKFAVISIPTITPEATAIATTTPPVLTPDTSTELYNVLTTKDEFDPIIKSFAQKYRGCTIEFDGNIANIGIHGYSGSKYDILVLAGDYSETSVSGPNFQFENVSAINFNVGDNVHIIAKVVEYHEVSGLFKLGLISIGERENTSLTIGASQYETLEPGSNGQAVLDARMKLYELGYFRKVPTQTEYTNNMKDYVKEFEKDFGLEQDGILSPEDQEILFAQSVPTPTPEPTSEPIATSRNENTQTREKWISSQFSIWDGAHKELEKLIIKNLNDEKSYKHIETSYFDIYDENMMKTFNTVLEQAGYSDRVEIGDLFIETEFSAKNAFNATIKSTAFGIASYKNNTIKLIAIQ